jgi:hypothetical protein
VIAAGSRFLRRGASDPMRMPKDIAAHLGASLTGDGERAEESGDARIGQPGDRLGQRNQIPAVLVAADVELEHVLAEAEKGGEWS